MRMFVGAYGGKVGADVCNAARIGLFLNASEPDVEFLPADVAASEGLFGIGCHTTLVGGLGDTIRRYPDDDVSAQFRKEFVDVPGLQIGRASCRERVCQYV